MWRYGVDANGGNPVVAGANSTVFTCTTGGGCAVSSPTWTADTVGGLSGTPAFYAVSNTNGGHLWVVGASGAVAVCSSNCNNTSAAWATQASGTTNTLYGVDAQSGNSVYAVGAGGTLVACTANCATAGTAWTTQTSGTTVQLNAVAYPSSNASWAVGNNGTIIATPDNVWAVVAA